MQSKTWNGAVRPRHWTWILILACCSVEAVGQPAVPNYAPVRVVSPFPPITRVPVKPVAAALEKIRPNELVIGVTVGHQSRAYPINMLTGPQREIINDTLGGTAIAATW